jgi:hypothetical protein
MTKQESAAVYAAYAQLESAAEQFYAAADQMAKLVPSLAAAMNQASEDLNLAVVQADTELDEVL